MTSNVTLTTGMAEMKQQINCNLVKWLEKYRADLSATDKPLFVMRRLPTRDNSSNRG